jgi:two-component system chemotaxis sensor kinase CheA
VLQDPALIDEFVAQSLEHLEAIEPLLLEIEKAGRAGRETLNEIFRAVHSIKGTAGFLGLEDIDTLSHAMESLLMRLRDAGLAYRAEMADPLLHGVDSLRSLLAALPDHRALIPDGLLEQLCLLAQAEPESSDLQAACELQRRKGHVLCVVPLPWRKKERAAFQKRLERFAEVIRADYPSKRKILVASPLELDLLSEALRLPPEQIAAYSVETDQRAAGAPSASALGVSLSFGQIGADLGLLTQEQLDAVLEEQQAAESPISFGATALAHGWLSVEQIERIRAEQLARIARQAALDAATPSMDDESDATVSGPRSDTVRVRVAILDHLMNLAGELVLGRNQLRKLLEDAAPGTAHKTVIHDIDRVTTELQESIMTTRMQPIRVLFDRIPRMTRDIARRLEKRVELEIQGFDVELDRSIVEALTDPMIHLLRNAVDHGLEPPDARRAMRKEEIGRLWVRAYHEGGRVVIEVQDDGRGINPHRVRESAITRGVITPAQASDLSEDEVIRLIFRPGLSTAESESTFSGRGVGMDVVRANVEQLGGQIEVESKVGAGTTFRIHLPLTLAIIPSLVIAVERERFAIPQLNVSEVVRLRPGTAQVAQVGGTEVLRLRGRLIPLVRLADLLGIERQETAESRPENVVLLRTGAGPYGLVVDELHDSEEILVKALSSHFSECATYAGAAILGDGGVVMILDALGLSKAAGLRFDEISDEGRRDETSLDPVDATRLRSLVLFSNGTSERFAIPLDELVRLEQVSAEQVDRVGDQEFLRHRGRAIPLLHLDALLPVQRAGAPQGDFFVLISRTAGRDAGIVAREIIDTFAYDAVPEPADLDAPGVLGSGIVRDRLTLFLDTRALLDAAGLGRAP